MSENMQFRFSFSFLAYYKKFENEAKLFFCLKQSFSIWCCHELRGYIQCCGSELGSIKT